MGERPLATSWLPRRAAAAPIAALCLTLAFADLSLASLALAAAPANGTAASDGADLAGLRERALELVNRERRERGLEALEQGKDLNEAALAHARDMLARSYYAHRSPEGETVHDRYIAAGGSRWHVVAENIARCAACDPPFTEAAVERLHRGWMDSPEHRDNILRRGLRRFGFALVGREDRPLYAVQTFAGPGLPRGLEPGEVAEPIPPEERMRRLLERVNEARQSAGTAPLEASPALTQAAARALARSSAGESGLDAAIGRLQESLRGLGDRFASFATIAGRCGGCGVEPTGADVRAFSKEWLDRPDDRARLLDASFTHLGFEIAANGEGRKTAMLVLAARR